MNKLAITALLVGGLFQATGCIITTDDDGDEAAFLDVSWNVVACPTDGAARVNSLDTVTDQLFTNVYDCVDGSNQNAATPLVLPLGDYDVWVEILDSSTTTVFATSLSHLTSLTVDGETATVATTPVYATDGFFGLTWNLIDAGSAPLACTDAGAAGVRVLATLANTTEGVANIFNCEDGAGVTEPMGVGLYTVVVDVMDSADLSIETSDAFEESIVADTIVDLLNFEFQFSL